MPTLPPTRPAAQAATSAVALLAGSRLVADPNTTAAADTLPQRLVWGGVRVVVLNRVRAQPTACTDDGGGGTSPRLPADATTVTCVDGDWGACFSRAIATVATDAPAVALFLHNNDTDFEAAAAAAAQAGVRVVRVPTAAAVETAVAQSHARAGALLAGVCMRASRESDLLARGMLPRVCVAGDSVGGAVFENLPPTNLARRLADTSSPPLDAILHKVTDELVAGGSACAGRDAWPLAARALAEAAATVPVVIVDDVARVMRLGDRWATADALEGACVPTPRAVHVSAGVSAEAALTALVKAGLLFPVIVKPRTACGTASAHALAVVLRASGLATALTHTGCSADGTAAAAPDTAVDTACCDIVIQQYVDHGGVLFKVYVAGNVVHVSRRPSVPDLGSSASVDGLPPGHDATKTSETHVDASWLAFDSTAIPRTASALAATAAGTATARARAAGPLAEPSAADLDGVVSALRCGLGLTLFGFDGVVDRQTGRLHVVDVNYFPSMGGVPPRAVADAVCAAVAEGRAAKNGAAA